MQSELNLHKRSSVPSEVAALIGALHRKYPQDNELLGLSDQQWERLLRFSDLAHLTLPLAARKIAGLPDWVTERLNRNLMDNETRFSRVKSTYVEAAEILRKAQVEYVLIKGFTLAPDYVVAPWLRQQSDLDLFCESESIERAQAALQSIGYKPDGRLNYSAADHAPTLIRRGDWNWRGNAFDPEMPLSIELHFCLWNERVSLLPIRELNGFFKRREARWIEGMQVPVLNQIDQLGYISMHILRNLLGRDSVVHHLYELAGFLDRKACDETYWSRWETQHSELLRSKEAIAFELAQQWFGCDLSPAVRNQVARLPEAQKAWLKHFGFAPLEGMFKENRDVVWLHWSLLRNRGRRLLLLRRTFFPNRIPNPDLPVAVLNERKIHTPKGKRMARFLNYSCRRLLSYSSTQIRTLYRGAMWVAERAL